MATIDVKDAAGSTVAVEKPLAPGRGAATASRPVALSNEDKAALDLINTNLGVLDGRVDGLETLITATNSALTSTLAGYLDGVEALLSTANTNSGNMVTALQIIDNMILSAGGNLIGGVKLHDLAGNAIDLASAVDHGSTDAGPPNLMGGRAIAGINTITPVSAGQRTVSHFDLDGMMLMRPHCALGDIVTGAASNTDGTSTQFLAAGASGIRHYLLHLSMVNASSSFRFVELKDGTTTILYIPLPAESGAILNFSVPVPGTAATAWNFDPSAATTTIYCSGIGFKSKV